MDKKKTNVSPLDICTHFLSSTKKVRRRHIAADPSPSSAVATRGKRSDGLRVNGVGLVSFTHLRRKLQRKTEKKIIFSPFLQKCWVCGCCSLLYSVLQTLLSTTSSGSITFVTTSVTRTSVRPSLGVAHYRRLLGCWLYVMKKETVHINNDASKIERIFYFFQ